MNGRRPVRQRPERALWAVLILLGLAACRRESGAPAPPLALQSAQSPAARAAQRVLYYPAGENALLQEFAVSMPASGETELDMCDLLRRYLEGPPGPGQVLAFPENSGLRAAFLVDGQAIVDLTGPVRTGGGTSTEASRVYGIVQTLHANFPEVKSVRILVDGQEVDTLLGHLDLSHPLAPEPRLLSGPRARGKESQP
jgi:hypothetical protein